MIDTIRIMIPLTLEDYGKIKDTENAKIKKTTVKGFTTTRIVITIGIKGLQIPLIIEASSYSLQYSLYLEFSVPKAVFGTNLLLFYPEELYKVLMLIKVGVEAYFLPEEKEAYDPVLDSGNIEVPKDIVPEKPLILPVISTWVFHRIDFCYVWKFANPDFATAYIEAMRNFAYQRKDTAAYDTSMWSRGRSFSLRWYLKEPELLKDKTYRMMVKHHNPNAEVMRQFAVGCLRFEIECRTAKLQQLFKVNHVTIKQICNRKRIVHILKKEMGICLKHLDASILSDYQIFNRLKEAYKKDLAYDLFTFYVTYTYAHLGKTLLTQALDKTTINRKFKLLSEAHIPLRGKLTLPDALSIPSSLVPNQSNQELPEFISPCPVLAFDVL